jgi:hypothetical protein
MRPPPRSQSYWSRRPATWPAAPCTAAAPASSTTSRLVAAAWIQTPSWKLLPIYQNSQILSTLLLSTTRSSNRCRQRWSSASFSREDAHLYCYIYRPEEGGSDPSPQNRGPNLRFDPSIEAVWMDGQPWISARSPNRHPQQRPEEAVSGPGSVFSFSKIP